jgi:2-haloacid dehalogenase
VKKHYDWLWFDADGTLFDYNRAEATALQNSFKLLSLQFEDRYLDAYREINSKLWQRLERHEIKPEVLRVHRFELLFETLSLNGIPDQFSTVYVEQLAICAELVDGAHEVLQNLHGRSHIVIVTNGLQAVQRSRVERSTIKGFIEEIIISEEVGAAKPHAAFFDSAMEQTGHPRKSDVLIIGDSLTSDIRGGVEYGLDTCWYNPAAQSKPEELPITYEIRRLDELLAIIE